MTVLYHYILLLLLLKGRRKGYTPRSELISKHCGEFSRKTFEMHMWLYRDIPSSASNVSAKL
jgi:hypothetical protein